MITVIIVLEKRRTGEKGKKLAFLSPTFAFSPRKFLSSSCLFDRSQFGNNDEKIEWFWIKCYSLFLPNFSGEKKRFSRRIAFRTKFEKKRESRYLSTFIRKLLCKSIPLHIQLMSVFSFSTIFPKKKIQAKEENEA
jgi:hypothetical protein